ncbi:hypothetical protein JST97_03340 [bacterium]|nr:hypothetical protein [bacterium]
MRWIVFFATLRLLLLEGWAQQTGWLTRLTPDFAELRTSSGLFQVSLTSAQSQAFTSRGLGSLWKVFPGPQGSLDSSEFLGPSPDAQQCLRQVDRLISLVDAKDWDGVYGSLSSQGKTRYSIGALNDYWTLHWLSPDPGDRKLLTLGGQRCIVLVGSKGVSFSRYGQNMLTPQKLVFVRELDWKLESYSQAGQAEWEK